MFQPTVVVAPTATKILERRIRVVDFNAVDEGIFYRSLAIVGEDYSTLNDILGLLGAAGYNDVIVETVGAGQNDVAIRHHVDRCIVVSRRLNASSWPILTPMRSTRC